MPHDISVEYLSAALAEIEKGKGPYKMDPLEFAESVIVTQQKIAHDALNGEWDPPQGAGRTVDPGFGYSGYDDAMQHGGEPD